MKGFALIALLAAAFAGCGGGDDETTTGPADVVDQWAAALENGDAVTACGLIADAPPNCVEKFKAPPNPPAYNVKNVTVHGDTATVSFSGSSVAYMTLKRVDGRWYIQPAG